MNIELVSPGIAAILRLEVTWSSNRFGRRTVTVPCFEAVWFHDSKLLGLRRLQLLSNSLINRYPCRDRNQLRHQRPTVTVTKCEVGGNQLRHRAVGYGRWAMTSKT
jgi:hypothetical protein